MMYTNETIINEYKDLVYRIALTYVKNRHDADDVFQDVFMTYFQRKRTFSDIDHQKAWLIRVTINRCKRHFINARKQNTVPLLEHDFGVDPDKDYDYLYEAILSLSPKQRMVVWLFYMEELSIDEITKIMNLSSANIKTILHRSRHELKGRIQSYE